MENTFYTRIRDEFLEPAGLINKEVSFWCEVKNYRWVWKFIWINCPWWIDSYYSIDIDWSRYDVSLWSWVEVPKEVILGHPYDLREVMRWFDKEKQMYFIWADWVIGTRSATDVEAKLDLSKPLRDQDLEPLYNLMKSLSGSVNQK